MHHAVTQHVLIMTQPHHSIKHALLSVELLQYRILSKKFVTPSAAKISSFEAIRAGMEKTVEGDEYLEFSDETLERRRNIRKLFCMGISC